MEFLKNWNCVLEWPWKVLEFLVQERIRSLPFTWPGLEVMTQEGCTISAAEKQIISATQLMAVILNLSFSSNHTGDS